METNSLIGTVLNIYLHGLFQGFYELDLKRCRQLELLLLYCHLYVRNIFHLFRSVCEKLSLEMSNVYFICVAASILADFSTLLKNSVTSIFRNTSRTVLAACALPCNIKNIPF